jgi:hypothetical protein
VSTELRLELSEADADTERLDEITQQLREELLRLDVDSVTAPSAGEAPPGSKGLELATIGALIVTLRGGVELAEKIVAVVRSWLRHAPPTSGRTVTMTVGGKTITFTPTEAQQQQLVDQFVRALAAP